MVLVRATTALALLATLYSAPTSVARPQYAAKIPNGYSVPNPGPQGGVWAGVGHVNAGGGGERNPFGQDFESQGFEWTTELCQADSDGDGRSNGQELGDPNCQWYEGGPDPEGPAVSHPGIVDEEQETLSVTDCDDYVAPEDELSMDITFSTPTQMDETQTHYICEQKLMNVPAKQVLHNIKSSIILDNSKVLHHMFVFICPANVESTDGPRIGEGPYQCSGNESGCQRVGSWAVGPHERCMPSNVGVELDFSELDQVVVKIEAHYDNASGEPQQDQSGIRLFFTPTLRPLTGSGVMVGMGAVDTGFVIPAQQAGYTLTGLCPTAITENLPHPIYVYSFTPHMHLFGRSLVTEHYRCGKKIGEIGRIDSYEFDNQQTYALNPPVKILPGDALVTTCGFDTTSVMTGVIRGGEETTDEMCLNFLSVYPNPATEDIPQNMNACLSFENGVVLNGMEVNDRFALGDRDRQTVVDDYESDPTASFGECCATNSCEDLHLAEYGEACSVDADCIANLTCMAGLCHGGLEESSPLGDETLASRAVALALPGKFLAATLLLTAASLM